MIEGSGKSDDRTREAVEELDDVGRDAFPKANALSVDELLAISLSVMECREPRGDRGAGIKDCSSMTSIVEVE